MNLCDCYWESRDLMVVLFFCKLGKMVLKESKTVPCELITIYEPPSLLCSTVSRSKRVNHLLLKSELLQRV